MTFLKILLPPLLRTHRVSRQCRRGCEAELNLPARPSIAEYVWRAVAPGLKATGRTVLLFLLSGILLFAGCTVVGTNDRILNFLNSPPMLITVSVLCIYFIPAGLAKSRKHRNAGAIFLLNLFLGWTFIGWVVALVWAACRERQSLQPTMKLLLYALCILSAHKCIAEPSLLYEHNIPLCRDPFRSVDGGNTFFDLSPLFRNLTNWNDRTRPMPEWKSIGGTVADVHQRDAGIIIKIDPDDSSRGLGETVHLKNHPLQDRLVDGNHILCVARIAGRYQYTTLLGGIHTIPSFDYGVLPTPERLELILQKKRDNYRALVEAAQLASSNRLTRQKMSSQNLSNFTITPPRPPP